MVAQDKIRILVGKIGTDAHDRGVRVLSQMLRDMGFEVVYVGRYQSPESIVAAALEEDVDVVGLGFSTGDPLFQMPRVLSLLQEAGAGDRLVIIGGNIPKRKIPELKKSGIAEVFAAGSRIEDLATFITEHLSAQRRVAGKR